MPGILGLVTDMPRERAVEQLTQMLESVRHESFYVTGTWMDEAAGIYVAWTAHKGSFSDGMPLFNEQGDVVLVFSGEEYPEPGTTQNLVDRGHVLGAEGPSYLVHLSEEDPSFPAGLNGRFHGLLCDRRRGTATLFNDRYGMHRIYYHESKEGFYFASEAKAILQVRPKLRTPDLRSLGEFITCGCVLEGRTLFSQIQMLPPASAWVFQNRAVERKDSYFNPREWEEQEPLEPGEYDRKIREVFSRNLSRYFQGQGRIGMSLTGGLDTRAIMAWQKLPAGSLPCYTFGGEYRDCKDVLIAQQIARICGQSHQVIPVGSEFLSSFPRYAERSLYLSDGTIDLSRSHDLYVNEKARAIAPVRMTGLYGDEVLRHLRTFKPVAPATGVFRPEVLSLVDQARATYAGAVQTHPLSFAVFRQAPWSHYGSLALEQTQLTMRTPFLDNDLVKTAFSAPLAAASNNDIRLKLIEVASPRLRSIRTDLGFGGSSGEVPAAASQLFLKFTFRAEYAYDSGMPQWLARIDHAVAPLHLERLFLGRHKVSHFRVWYRDALSKYVREILLDSRTLNRPYFESSGIENLVRGHLKGDRNYTREIHKVMTLELLHRLFFDAR